MKKSLLVALAAAFIMSSTTTAIYAANSFGDVPANHWAYKSVMELAKAGIVDGVGSGTFQGDKTVTRYEMAQIVAKAMTKVSKADERCKATVQKLQTEFAAELQSLGVKVDGLKTKVDNLPKISAEVRFRYDDNRDCGVTGDGIVENRDSLLKGRTRLSISDKINDSWTYNGRVENVQDILVSPETTTASYNLAWLEGKIMNGALKLGVFDYKPAYGLTADSHMKGLSFQGKAGDNFTYGVYAGKAGQDSWSTPGAPSYLRTSPASVYGVESGTKIGDNANVKASWLQYKLDNVVVDNKFNAWELGADVKLSEDWNFKAAYAKSNAVDYNKAYFAGVNFKGADKTKPGSFGLDLSCQYCQISSTYDTTLDVLPGFKGYKFGVGYTLDKNVVLKGTYIDRKLHDVVDLDIKDKIARAELFFYF